MAVTLIAEDGSVVANANTFAILTDLVTYATQRNKLAILPPSDDARAALLIEAIDYFNTLQWKGTRVSDAQTMPLPRKNLCIDGVPIAETTIPLRVIQAQCQAAIEIANGADLMPSVTERQIIKETVGPISTEYANQGMVQFVPSFPMLDAILAPFMTRGRNVLFGVRV